MELTHTLVKHFAQLIDIVLLPSRDEDTLHIVLVLGTTGHPGLLQVIERIILLSQRGQVVGLFLHPGIGIYLVKDKHRGFI